MTEDQLQRFKTLYDPLHPSLDRFCRMIAGNKMDGEDLLHDTVLKTMKGFQRIRDERAMQSYMFSIASNLNKRKRSRKKVEVRWDREEVAMFRDPKGGPDLAADFSIVHEHILKLPNKMAESLLLFYVADLKLEDIRKIQGGSLSGVKLRIKRGREKLSKTLTTETHQSILSILL